MREAQLASATQEHQKPLTGAEAEPSQTFGLVRNFISTPLGRLLTGATASLTAFVAAEQFVPLAAHAADRSSIATYASSNDPDPATGENRSTTASLKNVSVAMHTEAATVAGQIIRLAETKAHDKPQDVRVELLGTQVAGLEELSVRVLRSAVDKTPDADLEDYKFFAILPGPPGYIKHGPKPTDLTKLNPHEAKQVTLSDEDGSSTLQEQAGNAWTVYDSFKDGPNHFSVIKASTTPTIPHELRLTATDERAIVRLDRGLMTQAEDNSPNTLWQRLFTMPSGADQSPLFPL